MSFFLDGLVIHVDDPGHGEIYVGTRDATTSRSIAGGEIGEFLYELTTLALEGRRVDGHPLLPGSVTAEQARRVLPDVQRAVLLAAAGTERFDRMFVDPSAAPVCPLCVNCNEGTIYTPGPTISDWCLEHGHVPFGTSESPSWEGSQASYAVQKRWWARQKELAENERRFLKPPNVPPQGRRPGPQP